MLKTIIIVVFLVWILWLFYIRFDEAFGTPTGQQAAVICTDDVGFCPNGNSVERSGPNCEFEPCQ